MTRFHIKEDSESVVAGVESFREMQKYVEEKERECRDSRLNTALAVLSLWTFFSAVSDGIACIDWIFFNDSLKSNIGYSISSLLSG